MTTDKKKPAEKLLFSSIGQPSYVRPAVREIKFSGGFQSYGIDNNYPEYLLNIYFGSSQHQGIIQRKVDEIIGNGVQSKSGNSDLKKFINKCNSKGQDLYEIFRKIVNDHEIIGGFTLQLVWSKGSTAESPDLAEVYYTDISKYRFNKDYDGLLYSREWNKGTRTKVIKYKLYDPNNPVGTQILYYSGTMTRDWYPIPQYVGSIPAIETAIEIANFNKQTLMNGFFPSVMISFSDSEPTEEEKGGVERMIQDKWGGSSNTGKFILDWPGPDGKPTSIQAIPQPDLDKLFSSLKVSVTEDIFIGHRITDPSMFGLAIPGKLGGAKDYNQSYSIFQQVYVKPARRNIFNVLNAILEPIMANADLEAIEIEPINNVFTDEALIASQMSQEEIREKLMDMGYVKNIKLPPGQKPIIEIDIPPAGPGAPTPELKIKAPVAKI
jgi:hypothetical protein